MPPSPPPLGHSGCQALPQFRRQLTLTVNGPAKSVPVLPGLTRHWLLNFQGVHTRIMIPGTLRHFFNDWPWRRRHYNQKKNRKKRNRKEEEWRSTRTKKNKNQPQQQQNYDLWNMIAETCVLLIRVSFSLGLQLRLWRGPQLNESERTRATEEREGRMTALSLGGHRMGKPGWANPKGDGDWLRLCQRRIALTLASCFSNRYRQMSYRKSICDGRPHWRDISHALSSLQ